MKYFVLALIGLVLGASAAEADTLPPGHAFQECPHCPTVVVIPAGSFVMGSDEAPEQKPPVQVTIPRSFALATTETTFDQWEACVAAGGCARTPDEHGWGRGKQPVINVGWDEANDYARWLSRQTGAVYRLPTEAEWEYAARAGAATAFWWGDDVGEDRVNCRTCNARWGGKRSAPVASFPANPFGLHDLNGNVWEWVADCWVGDHKAAPTDGSPMPDPAAGCKERVAKGGAWYYYPLQSHPSARARHLAKQWSYTVGFRVLRELPR